MTLLKNDLYTRQKMKGDLATVLGILDDMDSADAEAFVKWISVKALLYRDAILNKPYHRLPSELKRGDIVLCNLGINIPPEFSDKNTGKHFVLFWAQQGHNAIVIPITRNSTYKQNRYTIPLGEIRGLPEKMNYVKLDAIRSVSFRRLSRIAGLESGKLSAKHAVPLVNEAIKNLFIED